MNRLKLTSWQRRRLERQRAEAGSARLYCRTVALLAFSEGRSVSEIAAVLHVARQSVYNWVEAYTRTPQPEALTDSDREGRPRRLGDDAEALLHALLARSPQELDYPNASWTVPLLQDALFLGTGHWFSPRTVRRALERLDYVWKRPRYVLAPDPEREKKTAYPPANPGVAAAECGPSRRRDRLAALPAVAGGVVATRAGGQGPVERPQCPAGHFRSDESAHRHAGAGTAAQRSQ